MKPEYTETPDETDFPLIDRCIECNGLCDWQPRYEMAMRPAEHFVELSKNRSLSYVPESRVVKICANCVPNDNFLLREMIRRHYAVYAAAKGI